MKCFVKDRFTKQNFQNKKIGIKYQKEKNKGKTIFSFEREKYFPVKKNNEFTTEK